jgi:hypothetical protein
MSFTKPNPEFIEMLKQSGDTSPSVAYAGQEQMAKALQTPLREAILVGDVTAPIFEKLTLEGNSTAEFPLDLLNPGDEVDFVAYTNPGHGRIPERAVEGDYIQVPTYGIANSIDFLARYARDARWDVAGRAMKVLEAGFVKKINDDAWHVLLAAGVDRNIMVYDADASAGQFTKRLVSLMKSVMRRNAGGNSGSISRGRLTDIYLSPEALEDIRNWGVDIVDETTRREIYVASDDGAITRIFGINLHAMDELGESQEYQSYFTSQLSGALGPSSDVELVVGLDMTSRDSFIMPVRQEVMIYPDPSYFRQGRVSYFGTMEAGFACLDNRRILLGSL